MTRTRLLLTVAGIAAAGVLCAILWPVNIILRDVDRVN